MENVELIKSLVGLAGVPLVLGMVKVIKPFLRDHRWYAVVSLAVGISLNMVFGWGLGITSALAWVVAIINSIMAGLAASGLYSGVSEVVKKTKSEVKDE